MTLDAATAGYLSGAFTGLALFALCALAWLHTTRINRLTERIEALERQAITRGTR